MLILWIIIIGLIGFIIFNEAYLFLASRFIKNPTEENLMRFMASCKYSVGRSRNNPDTWTKLRKVLHITMLEIDVPDEKKTELKYMLIRKGLKDTKYLNKIIKANSQVLDGISKGNTGVLTGKTGSGDTNHKKGTGHLNNANNKKGTGHLNKNNQRKGTGTLNGSRRQHNTGTINGTGTLNAKRRQTNTLNSGKSGEAKVNYTLKWLNNVGVINNVKLKGKGEIQQFDNIVISSSGIYHLEVKNIGGENGCRIKIQESGDWIREDNITGVEKGMQNPEFQLYRHQLVLEEFLVNKGFSVKGLVKGVIVIANENTIIEGRENARETIVKVDSLINYLESKTKDVISEKDIVRIYDCINKNDLKKVV
ncbi:MAG: nuclease-related domain-containing protein [Sarcina sp.]